MLLEKSERLVNLSEQTINLRKYVQHRQAFETRKQQIEKAISDLKPSVIALTAFRERNLANIDLDEKTSKLLSFLEEAKTQFKTNPEWIIDSENFDSRLLNSRVRGLIKAINSHLEKTWEQYLSQQMPSTDEELLNLLGKVGSFKVTVGEVRRLKQYIGEIKYPQNKTQFKQIDQSIQLLKDKWNNLNADDVPEPVLNFLKAAVNTEGAPIHLLTSDVKQWLERYDLSSLLRVRLS